MYHTNLHTLQELQAETEDIAEDIRGDMLHDTVNNFVIHLQQVHEIKGPHIEYVFTRPHAHKLSIKVSFHSCIICFCTLENYEYTV